MLSKESISSFIHGNRIKNNLPPFLLKQRSSEAFILGTVTLAIFTDIFLYSMIIPVLPFALIERANVDESNVQKWTSVFLAVYGAALAVGSLIFGFLADKSDSRRVPLLLGLLALGGSTAMLCAGSSLLVLIIGRVLQGLSASVVWTVGLALMSDTVNKDRVAQSMGYVATAYGVGSLAGPLLGGVVYEKAGYYPVFAMGFAIIGLDIFLRFALIEKKIANQWLNGEYTENAPPSLDADAQAEEIHPRVIKIEQLPKKLSPDSENKAMFSKWVQNAPPVITLLRIPRLLAALAACFVLSVSLTSFEAVLPLYVRDIFNWNSSAAGLIFICLVVPSLCSPFIGAIADRCGSKVITTTGLLVSVPFWVLLRLVTNNSIGQKVLLCALLTIIGACLAFEMAPIMAEIDHVLSVEEKRRPGSLGKRGAAGQGFGLFNFAYACGSLVGPLWAGFVLESAGWGTMGWSLGLLNGVAAVIMFTWLGGRIKLKEKSGPAAV